MKAVLFDEYGGPETLHLAEAPEPHAGPGEIRIAVRAAGVNAMDWKIRQGLMAEQMPLTMPAGTGLDAAGVVDEVGAGVEDVSVGDEVFGSGSNTYAELAVLTSWAEKPAGLSFDEAAGYPVPVETAIRILDLVGLSAGETVVVSGAAGGVGSAVLQIARARGITAIGTASAANQDRVRSLGATPVVYGDGFADRVRAAAPHGVDAALDIAGAGVIAELIELTGDPQKVVSIADFAAPEQGAQVSTAPRDKPAALRTAARLAAAGEFALSVERAFPLAEAAEAHRASQAGHVSGRLVLVVA